jgi:hypothetical protein
MSSSGAKRICVGFCDRTQCTTIKSGHIGLWTKMRRSGGQFSGPESSLQVRSLADFITTTSESKFSVHTARSGQSLEGWTHFNTRLRSGSVEVRLIRSRPRFAIKLWEFIEQIIRGEHDAAWYGRESPRATAHARISRRRISRHPIRGPSWQAQSA